MVAINLTALEMPDLERVIHDDGFTVTQTPYLTSVRLPALSFVAGDLVIDLSTTVPSPPAVDLLFPSLKNVAGSVNLTGNIDSVDLSGLLTVKSVNITSTGNLDYDQLARRVVLATPATNSRIDSVLCRSRMANVTTYIPLPDATRKSCGGTLGRRRGVLLWFGILGMGLLFL